MSVSGPLFPLSFDVWFALAKVLNDVDLDWVPGYELLRVLVAFEIDLVETVLVLYPPGLLKDPLFILSRDIESPLSLDRVIVSSA